MEYMFRAMYKDPNFIGAQTIPPNDVVVIMKDGIEYHKAEGVVFRSEASIDKESKELKGTTRGKDKIRELFIEPTVRTKGRFAVTMYEF